MTYTLGAEERKIRGRELRPMRVEVWKRWVASGGKISASKEARRLGLSHNTVFTWIQRNRGGWRPAPEELDGDGYLLNQDVTAEKFVTATINLINRLQSSLTIRDEIIVNLKDQVKTLERKLADQEIQINQGLKQKEAELMGTLHDLLALPGD